MAVRGVSTTGLAAGLSAAAPRWLVALVDWLIGYLRSLLLWYPKLPFEECKGGTRRCTTLPNSVEAANALASGLRFPPSFEFGAATAAYQIEGGLVDTNWNRWEKLKVRPLDGGETVARGEEAGVACDSWNRFEEDLHVLKQLGLTVYRFSVDVRAAHEQIVACDVSCVLCQPLLPPARCLRRAVEPRRAARGRVRRERDRKVCVVVLPAA